ncbi:glutathione S-transferase family protein [Sphingomonas oligophenolica]|uniref:Glutathione S-transferase family protein n=1 Tax=Sphingomonas oligophenolica TaxID=301154 RepID=A0ABU9Y8L2_9SPHN
MKLYILPGSLTSRKPLAVIHHLGLPVELIEVSGAEAQSPAYRAINPNGMAPTLVDGEMTLWESNAIGVYLAESTSDKSLFPPGMRARIEILRWLYWEAIHFNGALGTLFFEIAVKPAIGRGAADPAVVERAEQGFHRFAPVLEAHLADRMFMVGETITYADYAVASCEPYRDRLPVDFANYPAIQRHFDRVAAMPAWHKALGKAPVREAA